MLHEYITKEHEDSIRLRGCKQGTTDMLTIETLSGYMENEKHFDRLKREFKERVRQNANDFEIVTYGEFQRCKG